MTDAAFTTAARGIAPSGGEPIAVDLLLERARAAEAEKRAATARLADLEGRLAEVIATAIEAERARAQAAEGEVADLKAERAALEGRLAGAFRAAAGAERERVITLIKEAADA
jgi:hypothetical protein